MPWSGASRRAADSADHCCAGEVKLVEVGGIEPPSCMAYAIPFTCIAGRLYLKLPSLDRRGQEFDPSFGKAPCRVLTRQRKQPVPVPPRLSVGFVGTVVCSAWIRLPRERARHNRTSQGSRQLPQGKERYQRCLIIFWTAINVANRPTTARRYGFFLTVETNAPP